jgi:hypothetical protein
MISHKFFLKEGKLLFLILIIQLILVNNYFPITDVINDKPIINQDYPEYFSQLLAMKHNIFNIYTPYFMAGYDLKSGMYLNTFIVGDKILLIFSNLFANQINFLFKLYIFILNLIFPFVVYLTAKNFGLNKLEIIFAVFLSILLWQFGLYFHMMNWFGDVYFVFSSVFLICGISFLQKYLVNNVKNDLLLSFVTIGYAISTYLLTGFFLIVPLIILFIKSKKRLGNIFNLFLVLSAVIGLVFLIFLIQNLSEFNKNLYPDYNAFLQSDGIETILSDIKYDIIFSIIFFTGAFGIYLWSKDDKKRFLFWLFFVTSVFYFLYAYFASYFYLISYTTPKRFLIPLSVFLVFPASFSIVFFLKKLSEKNYLDYFLVFLIILIYAYWIGFQTILKDVTTMQQMWDKRLVIGIPDNLDKLVEWIKTNTTNDSRILIEDSGSDSNFQYYGFSLTLFPIYTNREFIGGPWSDMRIKENIPQFVNGTLSGRDLFLLSEKEFEEYFNMFNTKWIIVWSMRSKSIFDNQPNIVKKIQDIDKFSIYETNIKPSFFIRGSGEIEIEVDKVKVINATTGEIIIKYRFFDSLKTNPTLKIEEYKIPNNFNLTRGFIKISNNNVQNFELFM